MGDIVRLKPDLVFRIPPEFEGRSSGYRADAVVDEAAGSVQMGFRVARIESGGSVDAHVHSFEESIYVIEGTVTLDTTEGSSELVAGDYALARPIGEDADVERMLFLSHRRATLEDLRTLFGGMAGDGPGAFVELDPVPSRCFDGAWAQRADGDEWGKVVVFRSNGKLEVRIESARGRARILALLEGIGCEGDAP